jgi:O-antigen/teichoic acid export membrane protein
MGTVDVTASGARVRSHAVLVRNLSVLAGSQLVTWLATLLWTLVVPRAIGPTEMGLFTLAVATGGVLTAMIGLGMRPLLVRELAEDPRRAAHLVPAAIVLRAVIAVPALAGVALVARFGRFDSQQAVALYLGFGMAIFFVVYEPIQAAFQARQQMQYLAYADMLTKGAVSVLAIGLVMVGALAFGLLVNSITVMLAVMVLNLFWLRRFPTDWRVTPRQLLNLARDSLPYWGFAAFFSIYLWIDSLMLAAMTNSTVVGWYGLPTKLFGTLMFAPVIISTAWLPRLVAAHAEGLDRLWQVARAPLETVTVLSLPVCAGVALIADRLVAFLYGPRYAQATVVLVLLALSVPAMYVNIMVNQVLIARNRQMTWTKVMMLATVVNPALNLVLIPRFQAGGNGAAGAAVALLLTELLILAIGARLVWHAFDRTSLVRLAKSALATAGMAAAVLPAHRLGLAAQLAAGMVSFPLLAMALGVASREERGELLAAVRTLAGRSRMRSRAA